MMSRTYHTRFCMPVRVDVTTFSDPERVYEYFDQGWTIEWALHMTSWHDPVEAKTYFEEDWLPSPRHLVMQIGPHELAQHHAEVVRMAMADGWTKRAMVFTDQEMAYMAETAGTWRSWTSDTTSSSTNDYWTAQYDTASGQNTTSATWNAWNSYGGGNTYGGQNTYRYQWPQPDPEEVRRQSEATRKAEEERKKRAEELLISVLNEEEVKEYKEFGTVTVMVDKVKYKVTNGWNKNIHQLDENGKTVKKLCVHPSEQCPTEDNMVAQVLFLKHNPKELLKKANVWNY